MFFYWKRWFPQFWRLYFTGNILLWLAFLFEIVMGERLTVSEALPVSLWALGASQVGLLMLFGGLASALTVAEWKEKRHFLFFNSLGVSTKQMIGWSAVPLLCIVFLLLLEIHVSRPIVSSRTIKSEHYIPLKQPVSVAGMVLFFPTRVSDKFLNVELVDQSFHIKAESAYLDDSLLRLQSGIGITEEFSFEFNSLEMTLPIATRQKSLNELSLEDLQMNGGRREQIEIIKRMIIPVCFLGLFCAVNIRVLYRGKPVIHVLITIVLWWLLTRLIETSALPVLSAWLPLVLSGILFYFSWKMIP
jgi:hypothetical protein